MDEDDNGKFRLQRVKHQSRIKKLSNFHPFEVVGRCRETQLQMDENLNKFTWQDDG